MTGSIVLPRSVSVAALLVAAGRGLRMGFETPKQYLDLLGETVLARSIRAMAADPRISKILCVIHPDDRQLYDASVHRLPDDVKARLLPPTMGGATRQASGRNGLEALAASDHPPQLVLVHDAARPFTSPELLGRSIEAAFVNGAAIPAIVVTDTIKRVDPDGRILDTPVRRDLKAVQTPQGFRFDLILNAHRKALSINGYDFTDDASVAEWAGHSVHIFDGEPDNIKLTNAEDFAAARERLMGPMETRTGIGYDVHAFAEGDTAMLCGVALPHTHKLSGHSDADVGLHALTDAILGALGAGDIGSHFPPSDLQWKDANSEIFLKHACDLVDQRGGRITHLDVTLICEAPKIGPYREAMRERIAAICDLTVGRVGVKATTTEQLGFAGRREGIAAQAVATLQLPLTE